MIDKLKNIFRNYFFVLLLFVIEVSLFVLNYKPGTFFLGWDNLFPEMNFDVNIKRSVFALWQEYRGLGLLDGMSYAANLPHYLFLKFLSYFLPLSILRYFFTFLMHVVGGIGLYFLIEYLSGPKRETKFIAFMGALFYLFNIGTIQTFYAPYEVFIFHFAFLPLLLLTAIKYIKTGKYTSLVWFALVSLFSIPQAHVPTLFIVYIFALLIVLCSHILPLIKEKFKESKIALKRSLVILFCTFVINAYWGMPYIYSTLQNVSTISGSRINQMSTQDIHLRNKAFGDVVNTALLKGFYIDYIDLNSLGNTDYMMKEWRDHLGNIFVSIIGFIFFFFALVGILTVLKRRTSTFYPFITMFILGFVLLGNDIPIIGWVHTILSNNDLYFQVFRFIFTKMIILYALSYAVLLAWGISYILERLNYKNYTIITISFLLLLFYYSLPAWKGNFLYNQLKVQIPLEYTKLVEYMKAQNPHERVSVLPQPSFWGWTYNYWGYRGSGFLWYGIPQPTTDGAFLPWSNENENYYEELSNAIYSNNAKLFEEILGKYQISWLVVDPSIMSVANPKILYLDTIYTFLEQSNNITLKQRFGTVNIYQVNSATKAKNFVLLRKNLPRIGPEYSWNIYDKGYQDYGSYISTSAESQKSDVYYPFRSLFTGRAQKELEFKVEDKGDYFSFTSVVPKNLKDYSLVVSPIIKEEIMEIDNNNLDNIKEKPPQVYMDGELVQSNEISLTHIQDGILEVRVPKIYGYYSSQLSPIGSQDPKNCDHYNKGEFKHDTIKEDGKEYLRLTSVGASNCLDFELLNLTQRYSYLITVKSRNIEGKSLLVAIINKNSQRADIETYLPSGKRKAESGKLNTSYFILPPMEYYGVGYNIHLENTSIGRDRTVNDLGDITVNPIPYNFLTGLKIIRSDFVYDRESQVTIIPENVEHPNPSYYEVGTDNETMKQCNNERCTLVLSQSFDNGWKAYVLKNDSLLLDSWYMKLLIPFFGKEVKNHVLVNNWENGWELRNLEFRNQNSELSRNNVTIAIIYLPQYLEYMGFALLGGFVIYLLFSSRGTANKRFSKRQATLTGPTPPGTGV